jgi:dephospho-CoA kinase
MSVVIGVLGGVGSGKSTLARLLGERGLLVLDADAEARAATQRPEVLAAIAQRFGSDLIGADGQLDRARLAERAFADEASTADLNAIVHPAVRQRLIEGLTRAGDRAVVMDVPLLLESPLAGLVTHWVFLEAPEALREARVASRGWQPGERSRRESRQADLRAKRSKADHVLENTGSIEDLGRQVDALLQGIGVT